MRKPTITMPPRKDQTPAAVTTKAKATNEKKISSVINKGGKVTAATPQDDVLKNFNLKIMQSDLQTVNDLRDRRPKVSAHKKITVSLQDWMTEAVKEKIEREKKLYKL